MDDDVRRFFDSVPADRQPLFERLRQLVERLYPGATVRLSYGVPTFKTRSGWVAIGYWKDGVSLYTNGGHNIEAFKAAHPGIRTGTGAINLKLSDAFPEESLTGVIHHAMLGMKQPS